MEANIVGLVLQRCLFWGLGVYGMCLKVFCFRVVQVSNSAEGMCPTLNPKP